MSTRDLFIWRCGRLPKITFHKITGAIVTERENCNLIAINSSYYRKSEDNSLIDETFNNITGDLTNF
jgi:hypothetical protein